ncbi:prestin-like isoform X1 [Petromyzon marinus]|uniref:Solute carrier family 26 member 6-like isoform X1 n=1 Tax=Petromyzon marinus TaxID=7757 RepID=A0AAJ7TX64_PETMA|nr:solute carrier family 26 member 6-like isoform X1 [Petromyzon marinus]
MALSDGSLPRQRELGGGSLEGGTSLGGSARHPMSQADLEGLAMRAEHPPPTLRERLFSCVHCSRADLSARMKLAFPVLSWLPRYRLREWFLGDVFAGISTGVIQLPQGMAYALLAGVPPIYGLYASFYPMLVYFFLGTSHHISIGTFAVLSVMVGDVTERIVPDEDFLLPPANLTGTNQTLSSMRLSLEGIDVAARDQARVSVAIAVTFLCGIYQLSLGMLRFGVVATYLSEPMVRGFTTACSIHVCVTQLKYMFGVSVSRYSGPLAIVYTTIEFCSHLGHTNLVSLLLCVICTVGLAGSKELGDRYRNRLPAPIPLELILVVLATLASSGLELNEKHAVDIIGDIPTGLKPPVVPSFTLFGKVVVDAITLAIVGFSIAISMGKTFALKHGYNIDSNQELVAIGLSNIFGSIFHSFTISCAMSRSLVQDATGGQTQVAGLVSALLVLIVILAISSLFRPLPRAALAAVVLVNLKGMFKQFADVPQLWRTCRIDLAMWMVTFWASVLLGLDLGLAVAVSFALLSVVIRTQTPKYSILGKIPNTDIYLDLKEYAEAKEVSGIRIFQTNASLYFANADMYTEALISKTGLDPRSLIAVRKKFLAHQQRLERKRRREAGTEAKSATLNLDGAEAGHVVLPLEESEEQGLTSPAYRFLVLDFGAVTFVDTPGVKMLKRIFQEHKEVGVQVCLAGCRAVVVTQLERTGFLSGPSSKAQLFLSVPDAVAHCQRQDALHSRPALTTPPGAHNHTADGREDKHAHHVENGGCYPEPRSPAPMGLSPRVGSPWRGLRLPPEDSADVEEQ